MKDFELLEDEIRERIKGAKDRHVFSEKEIIFIIRKTWWDWNDKDLAMDVRRLIHPTLKH